MKFIKVLTKCQFIFSLKPTKPIKAKYTIEIASGSTKNVEIIPVKAGLLTNEEILIGYGEVFMHFEQIVSLNFAKI